MSRCVPVLLGGIADASASGKCECGRRRSEFIFLPLLFIAPADAQQQGVTIAGKQEYQRSCAASHGHDGTSNGAMAKVLKDKPPNLTQLSAKNNGFYPFWNVYRIIDGRTEIGAHGSGDMPIWGTVFKQEHGADRGADLAAYTRILEIVYYLESIQMSQPRKTRSQ